MPTPSTPPKTPIPESLRLQLADFRRLLWKIKIIEAITAGIIGLVVSFLLVYGLDRLIQTPAWLRLVILLAGFSLFAGFAPYWLHRWVWRRRKEGQLAQLIAKRYPGLGDRLLGVIELQNQEGDIDTLSPRLREAAMVAVAAEAGQRKLAEALPVPYHRIAALVAMAMIGAFAVTLIATPNASRNALKRWLMPLSDIERYTFTKLDHAPTHLAVPVGEAFDVTLQLDPNSEQKPESATGRYALQPRINSSLTGSSYHFTFPGQQDPGIIHFRIGDLQHELKVEPTQRPSVEKVRATIGFPDYLELTQQEITPAAGTISAVKGSTVSIHLQMNRPLANANFGPVEFQPTEQPDQKPLARLPKKSLEIAGNIASSPTLKVDDTSYEIPFDWVDTLGLPGTSGFRLHVEALQDAPPSCYLQGIDRVKLMLPEETVDFEVITEDDFKIKASGIEWKGEFTHPTDVPAASGELTLATGKPGEKRMLLPTAFSPEAFKIVPQKLLLRAWAEDQLPGRGRVYSEPVTIYVLTRNEHAQILKNRFDRGITELEDIARRELNLLEENERLQQESGEELQKEASKERIEKQQREEAETEHRMEELTKKMEDLLKDAVRNKDIDKPTLKKMAEALKSMQELSQNDVPEVKQKLDDANEASNTPEKTKQDVDKAVENQKEVVKKMQKAVEQANDANRKFEAGTFVKRLKKAAGEQQGITNSIIERYSTLFGNSKIDPSDNNRLSSLSTQQSVTASDVRWIEEDLMNYFARTQTGDFKKVFDEMKKSNIDLGLETIRDFLSVNYSFQAGNKSKEWAAKLNEWAAKLEGDKDDSDGGGGGGGGGGEDEDFEFMLRVMKMIQTQQDLRSQTRALEQIKRNSTIQLPEK